MYPVVQTTRTQIRGILSTDDTQVIFVDTPGIFRPKKRLERSMVSSAWDGAGSADHIVLLIDAQKGLAAQETQDIIEGLQKADYKVDVALNKIDCVKRKLYNLHLTYKKQALFLIFSRFQL